MKTERTIRVKATGVCRAAQTGKGICTTIDSVNLRPRGGCLELCGAPTKYTALADAVPVCRFGSGSDAMIVAARGSALVYGSASPTAPATVKGNVFNGNVRCAVPLGADAAIAMTDSGAVRLHREGDNVEATHLKPDFPPISLVAAEGNPVSTTVSERRLSTSYSGASRLSAADAANVVSDLVGAYLHIAEAAAAAGFMVQPAIGRYRLLDTAGRVLFVSAPVLLSHATGAQCCDTVGITSADSRTLNAYTLTARTWTLQAVTATAAGFTRAAEVARADIYLTPLFHPYRAGASAEVSLGRGASAQTPFLHVGLPGRDRGLGDSFRGNARRIVAAALAHLDELETCVATLHNPFGTQRTVVKVDVAVDADVAETAKRVQTVLGRAVNTVSRLEAALALPHTFAARCGDADAATTAWADITTHPFAGYGAEAMAASFGETAAWSAVTTVRFASGKGVVFSEKHNSPVPQTLNALLYYPLPDAEEICVNITSGGVSRVFRTGLEPERGGRGAFAFTSVVPNALTGGTPQQASMPDASERYHDAIVIADTAAPLSPVAATRLGGGAVNVLAVRHGSDSSWEFGRCRFTAGCDGGIYSVAVSATSKVACRALSHHAVTAPNALVAASAGEAFAISGNEIVHITAARRVESFDTGSAFTSLAWNDSLGELWALRPDGPAKVYCRDDEWRSYRRTRLGASMVVMAGGLPFAVTPSALLDLSHETASDADMGIGIEIVPDSLDSVRLQSIGISAGAERFSGLVTVEAASSGNASLQRPLTMHRVDGALRSALELRPFGAPASRLRITVSASVSPDFRLNHFKIVFSPWKLRA